MIIWRDLGLQAYVPIWRAMQRFTSNRCANTVDEIWFLEHEPVYTQGMNGKPEHILAPGHIPVIDIDRGGQVTYHGPGQLVVYFLLDIRRRFLSPRQLVSAIEQAVIQVLQTHAVQAYSRPDAPGIYVDAAKIASIGLRIRNGASYHGLSVNFAMDLSPFAGINPCGYQHLVISQISQLLPDLSLFDFQTQLQAQLQAIFL